MKTGTKMLIFKVTEDAEKELLRTKEQNKKTLNLEQEKQQALRDEISRLKGELFQTNVNLTATENEARAFEKEL